MQSRIECRLEGDLNNAFDIDMAIWTVVNELIPQIPPPTPKNKGEKGRCQERERGNHV